MGQAATAVITTALVCGFASPAFAAWSSEEPPARYVEASTGANIFVRYGTPAEVHEACYRTYQGALPQGWMIYGCSTGDSYPDLCIITLLWPQYLPVELTALFRRIRGRYAI